MPSRRKATTKKGHRQTKPAGPTPTTSCVLPHHITVNVLSRLPVKDLLRFRCVSKSWRTLIRNPKLVSLHLHRTLSEPIINNSFIIHSLGGPNAAHSFSLYRHQTGPRPIKLVHPVPDYVLEMPVVGSCNGILCLCKQPRSDLIYLWNPSTRHAIRIPIPIPILAIDADYDVSIGFGFDPVTNDYKVIYILTFKSCLEDDSFRVGTQVLVYSANSGSWRMIKTSRPPPPYDFLRGVCDTVVGGKPYWVAFTVDEIGLRNYYVWYDWGNKEFREVPEPLELRVSDNAARLVDWKDSFGVLALRGLDECVDIWTMDFDDNGVESLSKKFTVGPIASIKCLLGCLRNGEIVVENDEGKLFLYDPDTGTSKDIHIDGYAPEDVNAEVKIVLHDTETKTVRNFSLTGWTFEAFKYTESLASIKGSTIIEKCADDKAFKKLNDRTGVNVRFC